MWNFILLAILYIIDSTIDFSPSPTILCTNKTNHHTVFVHYNYVSDKQLVLGDAYFTSVKAAIHNEKIGLT